MTRFAGRPFERFDLEEEAVDGRHPDGVAGLPGVVRARYSTATVGRESMVGELGTAVSDVSPDGVVEVRDAPWRARTNRATPIKAGDAVRVAAIDGLLLEVEPLEGAAREAGH